MIAHLVYFIFLSLLQLDANLIEREPYNRLAQKNKRRLKCGATKFKYLISKIRQDKQHQCGVWSGVIDTQIFSRPPAHPWVKKHNSLTLNTKLRLQLTIWMALVQDI